MKKIFHWLDENLDPYTGEWLSRKILKDWEWRKDKGGYERGKDYNHSAYADLVISIIFGVEPQENGEIRIHPMLPDEWSYCRLEKIKCQGKDLSIIYDKTGEKYHQEKGYGHGVWAVGAHELYHGIHIGRTQYRGYLVNICVYRRHREINYAKRYQDAQNTPF